MFNQKHFGLWKVLEWILFLGLCIVSYFFMKGVLEKYQSKNSSFHQYEEDINENPTIVMCFSPHEKKSNNTLHHNSALLGANQFKLEEDFDIYFFSAGYDMDWQLIYMGNNSFGKSKESENENEGLFELTHLFTENNGLCYKARILAQDVKVGFFHTIDIEFNSSIPLKNLPKLQVFITSEVNSYGVTYNEWYDGKELIYTLEHKKHYWINLHVEKIVHLKDPIKCREESFQNCFGAMLANETFDGCSIKCTPISLPAFKEILPDCQTKEELQCAQEVEEKLWESMKLEDCPRPCTVLQYTEKGVTHESTDDHSIYFAFQFIWHDHLIVHEEYLIYDLVGMVGSVGGTLGMFIGFSFSNVISYILNFLMQYFPISLGK